MIVRVRGLEITCESLDELDVLIERYGNDAAPGIKTASGAGQQNGAGIDTKLLRAFVEAPVGLPSKTVEGMLKVQGKGIPGALRTWAVRVSLSPEAFEKANPGGKRGWRLTDSGHAAAKVLMGSE